MTKRLIKILLLIPVLLSTTITQVKDVPLVSEGDIQFYLDLATFKGESNKSYQEFYLMLFADEFLRNVPDNPDEKNFSVSITITDNFGKTISSKDWTTQITLPSIDSLLNKYAIYDQWGTHLAPGDYKFSVRLSDIENEHEGKLHGQVRVKSFEDDALSCSDIEFVSSYSEKDSSHFVKGNKAIIPNPWRRYGIINPILYFYYELYDLKLSSNNLITVTYRLINTDREIEKEFPHKKISVKGKSTSIFHGLNVANVEGGIYLLTVDLSIGSHNINRSFSRQFEIVQADLLSYKSEISDEELELVTNIVGYIATPEKYAFLKSLNRQGKIKYIIKFWEDLDPTPETPKNETLEKMQKRYHYANENFGWAGIEGWKSDRGKILIKYGMPTEIDKHDSESGSLPYEVWYYQTNRNIYFVFGDLRNDGRMSLIHSNLEGEVSNTDWKSLLKKL